MTNLESEVAQLCLTLYDPMDSSLNEAPSSTGYSRQEYWSGLPFPSLGNLPNPGIEPMSVSCIAGRFFTAELPGKPRIYSTYI